MMMGSRRSQMLKDGSLDQLQREIDESLDGKEEREKETEEGKVKEVENENENENEKDEEKDNDIDRAIGTDNVTGEDGTPGHESTPVVSSPLENGKDAVRKEDGNANEEERVKSSLSPLQQGSSSERPVESGVEEEPMKSESRRKKAKSQMIPSSRVKVVEGAEGGGEGAGEEEALCTRPEASHPSAPSATTSRYGCLPFSLEKQYSSSASSTSPTSRSSWDATSSVRPREPSASSPCLLLSSSRQDRFREEKELPRKRVISSSRSIGRTARERSVSEASICWLRI